MCSFNLSLIRIFSSAVDQSQTGRRHPGNESSCAAPIPILSLQILLGQRELLQQQGLAGFMLMNCYSASRLLAKNVTPAKPDTKQTIPHALWYECSERTSSQKSV